MRKVSTILVLAGFLLNTASSIAQSITLVPLNKAVSIRGLSVVDDSVAWLSGTKGSIAITKNGGRTWDWKTVKGYEKADFRDIEAFNDKEAVIMSSGTPALVMKTTDGGENWEVKYNNPDSAYFFDAMDFSDKNPKEGWIMGDAIKGKILLLHTSDGGNNWQSANYMPDAKPGEGAFAASGTCLRTINKHVYMVTGGFATNYFDLKLPDNKWVITPLPFPKSKASQGAFSVAIGKNGKVIVGGDYSNDKRSDSTACYSMGNGADWQLAKKSIAGFQSCVEYLGGNVFLATGTPGSNITTDGGISWTQISTTSFNVCRKAKHGKLVLLAGSGANIGIFKM